MTKLAGTKWKSKSFKCSCGNNIFIHEGTESGDGFNCWWHGYCSKCNQQYEVDSKTKVIKQE